MKHALRSKNALTVCIQEDKTNGEENNCSDFTMIFWCFGSGWVVMYERWSLTRRGHTWSIIILLLLHSTLKQPRPAGSSISLSNPRAQRLTRPSTCDMSPGMLLKL